MITKTIISSVIKSKADNRCGVNALLAVDDILQIGVYSESVVSGGLEKASKPEAVDTTSSGCTDRRASDLPVQIFGLAEGIAAGSIGRIAAVTALESLLFDIGEYIRKHDSKKLDIADFADLISENADHAVRQQLTAWQGMQIGTSLAWIMIENDVAYTYSVGDALLALFRDNKLYRITDPINKSDMVAQDFFLGYRSKESRLIPANLNRMPLHKGDVILILSSEITKVLTDERIAEILSRPEAFASVADSICEAARYEGSIYETAVLTVKVHSIEEQPSAPIFQKEKPVKKSRLKKI